MRYVVLHPRNRAELAVRRGSVGAVVDFDVAGLAAGHAEHAHLVVLAEVEGARVGGLWAEFVNWSVVAE